MITKPKQFTDSNGRVVVDVQVHVDGHSSVDSFIEKAAYDDDGSAVPEDELDYLTDTYNDYVQEYAYENGSRNHN